MSLAQSKTKSSLKTATIDKEICRHLDACGSISATSKVSGSVVFRLPKQEVGLVISVALREASWNGNDIETYKY